LKEQKVLGCSDCPFLEEDEQEMDWRCTHPDAPVGLDVLDHPYTEGPAGRGWARMPMDEAVPLLCPLRDGPFEIVVFLEDPPPEPAPVHVTLKFMEEHADEVVRMTFEHPVIVMDGDTKVSYLSRCRPLRRRCEEEEDDGSGEGA